MTPTKKMDVAKTKIVLKKSNGVEPKKQPDKVNVRKVSYLVCVSLILLAGLYAFIYSLQKSNAESETLAFVRLIDSHDYTNAYNSWLSDSYKQSMSLLDFDLNMSLSKNLIGDIKERKLASYNTDQKMLSGSTFITLTFNSSFEKDTDATEVVVIRHDYWQKIWEVESYRLISDQTVKY